MAVGDSLIVEGQADQPVYLWIHNEQTEIRPASHLWGRKTGYVERAIQEELGDRRIRVCQIGLAGERLSRIACVRNDVTHAAGRCGLGAVMGSKKLRAIAVRGSQKIEMEDAETIRKWARWQTDIVPQLARPRILHDHGTDGFLMPLQVAGGLPTRNFTEGVLEGAEIFEGERMTATILKGADSCYACPIRCKRIV
jgi:aldehyde:ferredoxin oxidoreductase